jgi:anaerobic ribonucleoside-triphosphate reductase activating protein
MGCQNADYLEFRVNQVVTVDQVWEKFQQISGLSGISFSGGEPFAQAVALAELSRRVQSVGKTVVCWTGYRLEQLQSSQIPGAPDLLQYIDLLIDGQFVQQLASDEVLRGSKNQQLYFLSGKIKDVDLVDIPRQEWVINSQKMTYTGFPD